MSLLRRTVLIALLLGMTLLASLLVRNSLHPELTTGPATTSSAGVRRPVRLRDGSERDLARPPGRFLIVHFWATWCPPCVDELPALLAFARTARAEKSLDFLAVSLDDDWKSVDDWLRVRQAADLPVALDRQRATAHSFGTEKVPESYFISPSGIILWRVQGPLDWNSPEVLKRIRQLKDSGSTLSATR